VFKSSDFLKPQDALVVFDIETIPQTILTKTQTYELEKRFKKSRLFEQVLKTEIDLAQATISAKKQFMAVSPYFGEIICIGLYWPESDRQEVLIGNEADILRKFWDRINANDFSGNFITFNGLSFDVPFIIRRSMKHKILPTNEKFLDTYRFQKQPHRDVYLMITGYDRDFPCNLDLACDTYDIPSPKHGEVRADNVYEYYLKGEIQKIADYCLRDVISTYQLFEVARKYIYI